MNSRPSFLFDPVEVAKLLDGLPHLRTAIPDPAQEGVESVAFAGMRKSERQLYRVLSNIHYGHLESLLRSLDFCMSPRLVPDARTGTLRSCKNRPCGR